MEKLSPVHLGLAALLVSACGLTNGPTPIGAGSGNGGGSGAATSATSILHDPGTVFGAGGSNGNSGVNLIDEWPPKDGSYSNITDVSLGAYALGPEISTSGSSAAGGKSGSNGPATCGALYGVVRDFKMGTQSGGHPNFETPQPGDDPNIVKDTLGSDGKPQFAGPSFSTTNQADFDQWYRDVPGVNKTFLLALHFVKNGSVYTFSASRDNPNGVANSSYFPLDNKGFGNEGENHNFSFTTEIHTSFTYNGGETFTFVGDDDVFVFINNKLVINLGGRHAQESRSVDLNSLGLKKGEVYPLAVFNAERHTSQSNFRVDTTLAFTNCGQINGIIF